MRLSKDPVHTVYKISQLIRTLTETDFEYLNGMAKQQEEFFNPLKPLTEEQHKLAEHNKKMIFHLKELKELLSEN